MKRQPYVLLLTQLNHDKRQTRFQQTGMPLLLLLITPYT